MKFVIRQESIKIIDPFFITVQSVFPKSLSKPYNTNLFQTLPIEITNDKNH